MDKNYITIIGAGAWGTAVADLLARNGHWVCMYSQEKEVVQAINQKHYNTKYLPDVQLLPSVWATTDPDRASRADILFIALPVPFLRQGLQPFRGKVDSEKVCVILSKGIEAATGKLPLSMIGEELGHMKFAVVSGPNFAHELSEPAFMATTVASFRASVGKKVGFLLSNQTFSVAFSGDMRGVALCGALKNVIALGIGMLRGLHAQENTVAARFTQALDEMVTLVRGRGGERTTVYSLAGVGDAVLSSLCNAGRNQKFGELIGEGVLCEHALQFFKSPPEGIATAQAAELIRTQLDVELPFFQAVYAILYHNYPASILLDRL